MHHTPLPVCIQSLDLASRGREVALRLGSRLVPLGCEEPHLLVTAQGLKLHFLGFKPISVDFLSGKAYHRRERGGYQQALARAVGVKPKSRLKVLDATAGLGRDAALLVRLGCQVTLCERCPVLHLLLEDALIRFEEENKGKKDGFSLSLRGGDARESFADDSLTFDVIYLDPMHPVRTKSALVKKEMRIVRNIVGKDSDADDLLMAARRTTASRVVVKRPAYGEPLAKLKPHHTINGKTIRYDVYLSTR